MKATGGILRLPRRKTAPPTHVTKALTQDLSCPIGKEPVPVYRSREDITRVFITDTLISVIGYEELVANSVAEVNIPAAQGLHSVNDPRLGVTEEKTCSTCHYGRNECPGHLGYIKFPIPIYQPFFLRTIIRVLNCVCIHCSCLYIPIEELRERGILKFSGINRLKAIEEASKGLCCRTSTEESTYACSSRPIFLIKASKEQGEILYYYKKERRRRKGEEPPPEPIRERKEKGQVLSIYEVEKILKAISPETAEALMFENGVRPENMIMRAFPVIPPNARPAIQKDGTVWHDDLTRLYMEIVRNCKKVQASTSEVERNQTIRLLKTSVSNFINNKEGYNSGSNKDVQGIHQRTIGKKGVFKGYLMGKRVDFSARTVISPDPTLKFGQIRIPIIWASHLTIPETIRPYNIKYYQHLIDEANKRNLPPPVSYIEFSYGKKKGQKTKVTESLFSKIRLREGDVIHRWLRDGDYIIGNRNPTLHKQGIMAFEVVLGEPLTVGLHLSYTTPMNADFDGDEINIHDLQTVNSRAELSTIMNVRNCIMNAQSNKPAVGVVYDGLVAAYLLTSKEKQVELVEYVTDEGEVRNSAITIEKEVMVDPAVRFDCWSLLSLGKEKRLKGRRVPLPSLSEEEERFRLTKQKPQEESNITYGPVLPGRIGSLPSRLKKHNVDINSGRALFSSLLPEDFYYNRGKVIIIDGVLIEGVINKAHIGPTPGSIIQVLYKDYGTEVTAEFLTDAYFVLTRWLTERGFSIGLGDCYPGDPDYREKVDAQVQEALNKVEALGTRLDDPIEEQRREKQIQGYVDVTKAVGMKIGNESITDRNGFKVAVASGAKGTDLNIGQITGLVGQQVVKGGRIPMTLTNATRCVPWFKEGELDPAARGFCQNSFFTGLTPAELFFHQAATRETVMESSVKTPVSGTIQDVVAKAFESFVVAHDGSIRDADNNIIQYVYANQGFAAEDLERVKIESEEMTSFIDLDRTVGKINAKYGYYPRASGEEIEMEEEKEIFEVITEEPEQEE